MQTYDVTVRAGNSGTVLNQLGIVANCLVGTAPQDLTGSEIVFRVLDRAGVQIIRKTTASGITLTNGFDGNGAASAVPNLVTIPITVADSRLFEAAGTGLRWEAERRIGGAQITFIGGALLVEPGVNDDA